MATSGTPQLNQQLRFRKWVKDHERELVVFGALIILATYVSKEIVQARLEDKIRHIELFFAENRLSNEMRKLRPDLRTELSWGRDAKKRYTDQDAAVILNRRKDGGHFLAFSYLVDEVECKDDQTCRAAEWFRYAELLKGEIEANERFAEVVGEQPLDQTKTEMERLQHLSDEAYKKLESGPSPPTPDEVDDYIGPVSLLGPALNARSMVLLSHGANVIDAKRRDLACVTLASGCLYFIGWCLTLVAHLYGVSAMSSAA